MWHADDRIDVRSVRLISLRSLKFLPIEEDNPLNRFDQPDNDFGVLADVRSDVVEAL